MRLRWIALGWVVAEMLVFTLLVRAIGLGATLLLGLATTVLGVVLLRRAGLGALQRFRRAAAAGGPPGGLADGLLSTLAAVLLIVPGFLANAVGLVLSAPSARHTLMARFGGPAPLRRRPVKRTDVIDLGPDDWRTLDHQ